MSELAEYIQCELEGYARSQQMSKLSRASGVDKTTLHYLKTGKRKPGLETLEKLLEAMEIDIVLRKRRPRPWDA